MAKNRNRLTVLFVPGGTGQTKRFRVPRGLISITSVLLLVSFMSLGFLTLDYLSLRDMRAGHRQLLSENQHLKGEAGVLVANLEDVKQSLRRIKNYTKQLGDIINVKVSNVSRKTGIGPLSAKEYSIQKTGDSTSIRSPRHAKIPLGINIDQLIFRPVLVALDAIKTQSDRQAIELQHLLSTLSQKNSLLSSIPSISPVHGWITSNFGMRVSPFTGERSMHRGIDVAAPIGTPIVAPADGVVIFSGAKAGFGKFIMVAHYGYGIVTRYGHNAQNMVQAGQKVKRGDQLGTVGMTGRTTGPHLHYEIWVNGQAANPKKFILDTTVDFLSN